MSEEPEPTNSIVVLLSPSNIIGLLLFATIAATLALCLIRRPGAVIEPKKPHD